MADVAPGHHSAYSEPPPCYNCGMRGHIFTACPEPTRAVPAGLEASRARQASGSRDAEHPNKRHKGPIVTRYSQPPSNFTPNHYPAAPPGQSYPPVPPGQHYPFPAQQPYPPGPAPPPYHGQYASWHPPSQPHYGHYGPPQPHSVPSFTQPPYQPYGPPGNPLPPFITGPPLYPDQGYPHQYGQPPVHPPPLPYGYGPSPGAPGPLAAPPPGFQPPDFRQHSTIPPPNYSGYAPPPATFNHDTHRSEYPPFENHRRDRSHDRYARDQWNDRREDRRNEYGSDQRRPPRDHSRDERWHDDRGRQGGRGRFDRRKHDRPYGERTTRDREPFRSHSRPGSEMSNRSGSQKPALTLNSSAHTTPKQATPASAVALPRKPEEPSRPSEVEDVVVPVEIELSHEVAGPEEKPDVTDNVATTSETRNETSSEDDDDIRSDKGFLRELEVAFAERSVQHQADPIAEPLPGEYSEQIMLPPAFDVKGVKSKYITSANLDDFALSVRDTNQWNKYRNHPAFLPPGDVNIHNLGVYLRSIQKGQGIRHDKRGRHTHAQNHGRDQGRSQRFNNRGDKDQRYSGPFQRKRKWEERVDTISGHEAANSRNLGYHLQYPELFEQPPRQASPEPGEISDTPVSVVDARAWPILPLPPKDDSSQWSRSDPVYVDDHGRHQPILDQSRNYDDGHSKFDRPGAPLHSGGHSRSPHYTGWGHPSLSPRPHEHFEPSDSYQRRSASPKPLLDDLQSHIDRLCSGATSDNDRVISSKEQVNHTEDRGASQNVFVEMPPRRGSQASNSGGRPVSRDGLASRRSSLGNISQASDLGSPLTRIEAELLGLIGADGDDSDTDSLKRQQEDTTHKRKQRKKVHSVYDRRW